MAPSTPWQGVVAVTVTDFSTELQARARMTSPNLGCCVVCENSGREVREGWVGADRFWICRLCAEHWRRFVWRTVLFDAVKEAA